MKVLHLTLKKRWFDMIVSGEKKEEYREIKPYWQKRLLSKSYDVVKFRNGYKKDSPTATFYIGSICQSLGIVEWGAPESEIVFIIVLGKRL